MLLKTVHIDVCNVYFLYSIIYNLLVFFNANKSIFRQLYLYYIVLLPTKFHIIFNWHFWPEKESILPLSSAVCVIDALVPYSVTTVLPSVALPASLCNGMALDL